MVGDPVLEPLAAIVGDATVVGLGVTTHGAREVTVQTHRIVRFLVERLGFRAVGTDEAASVGRLVDAYVREGAGAGDARAVVGGLWPHHRTVEVLDIVEWMRGFARGTPDDPVRFAGLGPEAHEDEGDDGEDGEDGDDGDDPIGFAEARIAEAALRWREEVGSKLVVISGATHTAVAPERTVTIGSAAVTHRNAGSRLRDQLGDGYVSLGLTFHHGTVDLGGGDGPHEIPPPPARTIESTLGDPPAPVMFDLHAGVDERVGRWLDTPATMRLVGPAFDPDEPSKALMSGGSLAQWFEALVHIGTVAPVTVLPGAVTPDT